MANSSIPNFSELIPYNNFEAASRAILSYLHQRLGFGLWIITRACEEDCVVLRVEDHGYAVDEGTVLRWTDSFCSRMVQGLGPRIAPDAQGVPVYAEAPISQQVPIGAYIGVPIQMRSGHLFGTLCAIDPEPQDAALQAELPLIEFLAQLLGSLLATELAALEQIRLLELTQGDGAIDLFSGLYGAQMWEQILEREEQRARRYGFPCCVAIVKLENSDTAIGSQDAASRRSRLRRAGQCLKSAVRQGDFAARLNGDEFGVMAINCSRSQSVYFLRRLHDEFARAQLPVTIGWAMRHPSHGIAEAVRAAEQKLQVERRKHYWRLR